MMDAECRAILRMTWDLVLREHKLLEVIMPTTQDVAKCMIEGRTPTPEQVAAWSKVSSQVAQSMVELTAALQGLRVSIDPLIGYDA
jgi:hypothetical protein